MMRGEAGGGWRVLSWRNTGLWANIQSVVRRVRTFLSEGQMDIPESRRERSQEQTEIDEENRRIRRLQIMMSMVMSVISQDPSLTVEQASELVANTKRAALAMFPDKEFAYDIIYKPRLQRLMRERFRLQ